MKKSYIWSVEAIRNENGKFDVWLGEENASGLHYTDLTVKEIGEILTQDIEAVNDVCNSEDTDKNE